METEELRGISPFSRAVWSQDWAEMRRCGHSGCPACIHQLQNLAFLCVNPFTHFCYTNVNAAKIFKGYINVSIFMTALLWAESLFQCLLKESQFQWKKKLQDYQWRTVVFSTFPTWDSLCLARCHHSGTPGRHLELVEVKLWEQPLIPLKNTEHQDHWFTTDQHVIYRKYPTVVIIPQAFGIVMSLL